MRSDTTPDAQGRSADDALVAVTRAVASSVLPVLLIRLPSKDIVAASSSAVDMLTGNERPAPEQRSEQAAVVGRNLESFMADTPPVAPEMLMTGRLRGFVVQRMLRAGNRDVATWIQMVSIANTVDAVVAVLDVDPSRWRVLEPEPIQSHGAQPIVGSTDANLVVNRISSGIEGLIGEPPSAVVGRSLLMLVEVADLSTLLSVLAGASPADTGVRMDARLRGHGRVSASGQLIVVPLDPIASCMFAFTVVPTPPQPGAALDGCGERRGPADPSPGAPVQTGSSTERPPGPSPHGVLLSRLTTREAEIVCRLICGDRVPGIARELFLAQSTVRNHLSAAYAKLGVFSQQAVIDLFRNADTDPDILSSAW